MPTCNEEAHVPHRGQRKLQDDIDGCIAVSHTQHTVAFMAGIVGAAPPFVWQTN
jgi:hypothetical protein